ncbi:zinc-binding alcohol dehydrogenase family protein [Methylotenera sp. N17]|uniref:zinc-binding alcohol dehydrogenase family protein n=1 Tax=Methylotenera sp. N17 TaxID=1502761 RepID=UPI0006457D36|nr:zinc-binding alcohol dehydrogenase family protein [Methylotenera sp. N17]
MKAVGYYQNRAITQADALVDLELPMPHAEGHDVLVEVKAISVNPVDTKVRKGMAPEIGAAKILGWDATGVVASVGSEVIQFKAGDRVWYAGSLARAGSNSEYQLVDERIVGHMPKSQSFAEAAALPLTSLTAWELLFDRLEVQRAQRPASLLVIGASGGVGSVLVQLAKQLTSLTIIATASRPESTAWLQSIGAHHVINHHQNMQSQLAALDITAVDYVISLNKTDQHFAQIVEIIQPQGKFALIDDPELFDVRKLKRKSVSLHWELMFTRALFNTHDLIRQQEILNQVAQYVDQGLIKTTLNQHLGRINAAHLKQAHALLESQQVIGKIVLEDF